MLFLHKPMLQTVMVMMEVLIFLSGGTGNYTYLWSNGSITEDVNNLVSGLIL